jgi:hypothetical protein
MRMRAFFAAVVTGVVGVAVTAAPASAANQSGLVNVAVVDNTIQIPIAVAANVCGVTVDVLSAGILTGPTACDAVAGATATAAPNQGGGSGGNQSGLVNLYVANNTVQVPVGIAANVCGVTANVLSTFTGTGGATCNATGNATATG